MASKTTTIDKTEFIASRFEPRIARALRDAFQALRNAVSERQILRALTAGGIPGVIDLFANLEPEITARILPPLQSAVAESGRVAYEYIPGESMKKGAIPVFNPMATDVSAIITRYTAELVRQVSLATKEGIKEIIQADMIAGMPPAKSARTIKTGLGLTSRQEKAVQNYETALRAGSKKAAGYKLRDRRFDPSIGKDITEDAIEKRVAAYRRRYIKHRAMVIARTESLRAATMGHVAGIDQMISDGTVDQSRLLKFWVTARDARVRDAHKPVPGLNKNGVSYIGMFITPLGMLRYPRDPNGTAANTAQCRCSMRYGYAAPDGTTKLKRQPRVTVPLRRAA